MGQDLVIIQCLFYKTNGNINSLGHDFYLIGIKGHLRNEMSENMNEKKFFSCPYKIVDYLDVNEPIQSSSQIILIPKLADCCHHHQVSVPFFLALKYSFLFKLLQKTYICKWYTLQREFKKSRREWYLSYTQFIFFVKSPRTFP